MQNHRWKSTVAVAGAFLLVLGLGVAGWAMVRPSSSPIEETAQWQGVKGGRPSVSASALPTTQPPTPTPTPSPTRRVVPKPTATAKPPAAQRPPAPVPKPTPSPGCTPTYSGPKAPLTDVRDALVSAGARQYWVGVV